jgi:hypothetical protein
VAELTSSELAKIRAFIDAAREAALIPEFDAAGCADVQQDLDYLESQLVADHPDLPGLRAVGARLQAVILRDDLLIPLPVHHAIASFPAVTRPDPAPVAGEAGSA